MTTPVIRLPRPHPGQIAIRESDARFRWLSAGRRWRKTTLAMSICVEHAMHGGNYLWLAPTFDQVRIGFNETQHAMGGYGDFNLGRMTLELPCGGTITYRSLDNPNNARGFTADGVVIDEASFCKPQAWYEVLRPMLIDTNGWSLSIATPNGRNWFHKEWDRARRRDDSEAWQVPTLGVRVTDSGLAREPHPLEKPDIPFEEIENLYQSMPQRIFEQEILAQFMDDGGGVFRNVMQCMSYSDIDIEHAHVIGVDLAKSNDFTVFSVIDIDTNQQVYMERSNKVDLVVQLDRLIALNEKYNVVVNVIEVNFNEMFCEQAMRAGLPVQAFRTTNATKAKAVEDLALAFERSSITILEDEIQKSELQAFQMTKTVSGMVRYAAPEGFHDDTVIALALAWQAARMPSSPLTVGPTKDAIWKAKESMARTGGSRFKGRFNNG